MIPSPAIQANDNSVTEYTVSASIRNASSSDKLLFCINFRTALTTALQLETRRNYELTRNGNRYKIRFLDRQTARTRRVNYVSSTHSAVINIPQSQLGFDYKTTFSKKMMVELYEDRIEFELDPATFAQSNGFIEPAQVIKLHTAQDIHDAGFVELASWGREFQVEVDERIREKTDEYFKIKLEMFRAAK